MGLFGFRGGEPDMSFAERARNSAAQHGVWDAEFFVAMRAVEFNVAHCVFNKDQGIPSFTLARDYQSTLFQFFIIWRTNQAVKSLFNASGRGERVLRALCRGAGSARLLLKTGPVFVR